MGCSNIPVLGTWFQGVRSRFRILEFESLLLDFFLTPSPRSTGTKAESDTASLLCNVRPLQINPSASHPVVLAALPRVVIHRFLMSSSPLTGSLAGIWWQ